MPESARKIIVVEDEADTAEMLAEMMRLSGYEVLKTYGGTKAIGTIVAEAPDLVLLDVMMPDLSGLEILRFMRRDPRLAEIPVVIVSAKGLEEDIRAGLEAGASVYLTKPIGFAELKSSVEGLLNGSIPEKWS